MQEVNLLCLQSGFTLLCCYSVREAAKYLTSLVRAQSVDPDILKGNANTQASTLIPRIRGLITVKDSKALVQSGGNLASVLTSSREELALIPGIGETKSSRLHALSNAPLWPALRNSGIAVNSPMQNTHTQHKDDDNEDSASANYNNIENDQILIC